MFYLKTAGRYTVSTGSHPDCFYHKLLELGSERSEQVLAEERVIPGAMLQMMVAGKLLRGQVATQGLAPGLARLSGPNAKAGDIV